MVDEKGTASCKPRVWLDAGNLTLPCRSVRHKAPYELKSDTGNNMTDIWLQNFMCVLSAQVWLTHSHRAHYIRHMRRLFLGYNIHSPFQANSLAVSFFLRNKAECCRLVTLRYSMPICSVLNSFFSSARTSLRTQYVSIINSSFGPFHWTAATCRYCVALCWSTLC